MGVRRAVAVGLNPAVACHDFARGEMPGSGGLFQSPIGGGWRIIRGWPIHRVYTVLHTQKRSETSDALGFCQKKQYRPSTSTRQSNFILSSTAVAGRHLRSGLLSFLMKFIG